MTHLLVFFIHTQEARHLDDGEQDAGEESCPDEDYNKANALHPETRSQWDPRSVQITADAEVVDVEESNRNHAPDPASAVNREGLHRIVDLQLLQELPGPAIDGTSDEADEDGRTRMNVTAAGGDGHKPTEDPAANGRHSPCLRRESEATDEHSRDAAGRRTKRRVHRHQRSGLRITEA